MLSAPARRTAPTGSNGGLVVRSSPVVTAGPDFFGFPGLTDLDQYNAGSGVYRNTQFDVEPPDQGLCAGNGFVVEAVNNAVAVYSRRGTRLTAPTALNEFFRLPPEISAANLSGPALANPKCYFDRDTKRWFLSELEIDLDPVNPFIAHHSAILLAVSNSGDPTAGYAIYSLDTTDASNAKCPCFGDRPLLGADANGIFISANEYPLADGFLPPYLYGFVSPAIYAVSKTALAHRTLPTVVHFAADAFPPPYHDDWTSIQPSTSPDTSQARGVQNGTEYFLSAQGGGGSSVVVWALTNTRTLADAIPNLSLHQIVIDGRIQYNRPGDAVQKAGPAPVAFALREPLEKVSANELPLFNRMNQVVFARGRLWSGLTASCSNCRSSVDSGIAFFAVAPAFSDSGSLTAKIEQAYVGVAGQFLMNPAVGVNSSGGGIMAATLIGPAYYPTAVYVTQDGKVHIAGPGAGPDDGFSGYFAYYEYPGVGRWGDSSAAVADADGSIWFATEYIPGGARTQLANWGTFIGHVRLH